MDIMSTHLQCIAVLCQRLSHFASYCIACFLVISSRPALSFAVYSNFPLCVCDSRGPDLQKHFSSSESAGRRKKRKRNDEGYERYLIASHRLVGWRYLITLHFNMPPLISEIQRITSLMRRSEIATEEKAIFYPYHQNIHFDWFFKYFHTF